MEETTSFKWRETLRLALITGVVALSICLVGIVRAFAERDIIGNVISLGQVLLFGAILAGGYLIAQEHGRSRIWRGIVSSLVLGVWSSLPLVILVVAQGYFDLRRFFISASPALFEILTFGREQTVGLLIFAATCAAVSLVGAGLYLLPQKARKPITMGIVVVLLVGLLSEIIILAWGNRGIGLAIRRVVFAARGLSFLGASLLFVIVAGLIALMDHRREKSQATEREESPRRQRITQWTKIGVFVLFLLLLPFILRTYLSEVIDNIGLYILMGLGLNIVVGLAGLLDLGYVAFYAIGAYTMGVLTSQTEFGLTNLSFWGALPICVGAAVLAGVVLGIPVLRMRGDYLAIVTLGFGEIIRLLAQSDALAPFIGGAQGILKIPKAQIGDFRFVSPESLYYIILAGCALAVFITWRLRDARLGRQWMAMREDEDVAEAMGINLVKTKLLAFAIGAGFGGLSGAILAPKLGSIFPASFDLMVSINVLCLIIVGGIASVPGVAVGALILVGLPELLREFAEYRMLMYGALLIVMMLARPEGFLPSAIRKRELHAHEETAPVLGGSPNASLQGK